MGEVGQWEDWRRHGVKYRHLRLVIYGQLLFNRTMPDWIAVILLGIVEGITEFLPVSSTGHLLIAEHWLHINQSDLFNVVIQSGAVLAVIPLFHQRFHQFLFQWREKATQTYAAQIVLAVALTGGPGYLLEKRGFKLPEQLLPVAWALLIGGVGFVVVEAWLRGKTLNDQVTWTMAAAVGIGQLVAAVFPGASRSGTPKNRTELTTLSKCSM